MRRTKMLAVATAAGLLMAATACGDDDSPAQVDNVASSVEGEQEEASSQDEASNQPEGPIDATPGDEVVATVSGDLPRGVNRDGRVPLRLDVLAVQRNGDLVDVTLVMTNEDDADDYAPYSTTWGDDAFKLVHQESQQVYLPAMDSEGDCMCNTFSWNMELEPGGSVTLHARYGGIPDDVTTVDIQSEYFAPMSGVPVSG